MSLTDKQSFYLALIQEAQEQNSRSRKAIK